MASLSVRAFDQAQRRHRYPARTGALGIACLQRDLIAASEHLMAASKYLWPKEKSMAEVLEGQTTASFATPNQLNENIIRSMVYLLQISGSVGLDLVSAVAHAIEKEEMAVV